MKIILLLVLLLSLKLSYAQNRVQIMPEFKKPSTAFLYNTPHQRNKAFSHNRQNMSLAMKQIRQSIKREARKRQATRRPTMRRQFGF